MGDSGAGFEINAGVVITIVLIVIVLLILASCINIVPQAHAYIIERLGGYLGSWQNRYLVFRATYRYFSSFSN